jgi:hypothetical protein
MIQVLYFPELAEELKTIRGRHMPLYKFVADQKIAKITNSADWFAAWNPKPYYDDYGAFLQAFNQTMAKCRTLLNAAP